SRLLTPLGMGRSSLSVGRDDRRPGPCPPLRAPPRRRRAGATAAGHGAGAGRRDQLVCRRHGPVPAGSAGRGAARRHGPRRPAAPLPRPLEAYAGEYRHPGYGALSIAVAGDTLRPRFGTMDLSLPHRHYETFDLEWHELGNESHIFPLMFAS